MGIKFNNRPGKYKNTVGQSGKLKKKLTASTFESNIRTKLFGAKEFHKLCPHVKGFIKGNERKVIKIFYSYIGTLGQRVGWKDACGNLITDQRDFIKKFREDRAHNDSHVDIAGDDHSGQGIAACFNSMQRNIRVFFLKFKMRKNLKFTVKKTGNIRSLFFKKSYERIETEPIRLGIGKIKCVG